MNFFDGIKNFLEFVNDNWTALAVMVGLVFTITGKAMDYFSRSRYEKIEIVQKQIQATMLKLVTDAEKNYDAWNQAGSIKRAQVIETIFSRYPILSKVSDPQALIAWIDRTIDEALITLRKVVTGNKE